ncbi:putative ABC transporter ATP-binding protein YxlF [compost metagenome]
MIQIDHLSKKYRCGSWALLDVNLTLSEGMIGLLGPNGAGKSSLMRILATLISPTSGDAYIHGISVRKAEDVRKLIGYLPQQFQAYPQLTGREYLNYVATMKGVKDSKFRRTEVERLIEEVNLTDKADKKVRTYSGGMKRRLGIAQALIGSPSVLIVDEPTAGLDPEERVRFRNLLTRFSLGRIVLLSTHIVADIESNCRQIVVLNKGSVKLSGQLSDLQRCGEGRVWEGIVSEQQYAGLDPMSIVSARRTDDGLLCRMIGETSPTGMDTISVSPGLEDGYLALLRSDAWEDDGL